MENEKAPEIKTGIERLKAKIKERWKKEFEFEEVVRKSPEFKRFLAEQILLPPEKWSEKFKNYFEKKKKLLNLWHEGIPDWSNDDEEEFHYNRYMNFLDFSPQDLKDKKIIDLGCGEGSFIKRLLKNGITNRACGIDVAINPNELDENLKKHFIKGDFKKEIPGNNYDYIVSIGAIGPDEENKETITSALKALKQNGEIRIEVINVPKIAHSISVDERKRWERLLESLNKEEVEYKFLPTDVGSSILEPDYKDAALHEVLIIKKKK